MKLYVIYYFDYSRVDIDNIFLEEKEADNYINESSIKDYLFKDYIELRENKLQELNRKIVDYLADNNI